MKKEPKMLPGQPADHKGPVFREPWEASAFAIVVKLSETGCFTWPEWVECLSKEIAEAEARHGHDHEDETGIKYYYQWFAALEKVLVEKKLLDLPVLDARHRHFRDNPVPHAHVGHKDPLLRKER